MSAALAVCTRWWVKRDPLPLARLPLQHAPNHPELDASPHEAVPKGLSGFLRRSVASQSRVPPGICRLGLANAVLGERQRLLTRAHHVLGDLAFEFDRSWNFADFSSPHPDGGFQIGQKTRPMG